MAVSRRAVLVGLGEVLGVAAVAVAGGWMARGAMLPVETEPAEMHIDRTSVDFGVVAAGPELRATFAVRNAGVRRLVLRERGPGCDCLGGDGVVVIPPNESTRIEATLPTRDRSGPIRREIEFATSDPRQPVVKLVLKADVRPAGN